MPMTALIGSRIREHRILAGLRQAELAQAAGISASYLNLIEHNRRRVAGDLLTRLAQAIRVDLATLTGATQSAIVDRLREAAAAAGPGPEADRAEDFAGRFPGWAALVIAQQDRIAQMERSLESLSDRMSHDPHLSASLHELLSAAASVRSTAAILADTPDIEPDWRERFQRNLADDSTRLSAGAEALVGYLDGVAAEETGIAAPQEELEAWLDAKGWHLPELERGIAPEILIGGAVDLASQAARHMARDWLTTYAQDAVSLPLAPLMDAIAQGDIDPGRLAKRFGVDPAAVFRRLACLPAEAGAIGLVVCDGSGTLVSRKPLAGFALPRFGAACPLWPLYLALSRPAVPVRARVEMAGRTAKRFLTYAFCQPAYPEGFDAPPILRAYMLILPDDSTAAAQPIGTSCRICPRSRCYARREPAIMAEGG
ncbi:MAG: short-chain fatty acyl-CoA regulator family protein [Gemmobacter sp.]|nr:short-chain fatty acyl-CoA regulator family protein [Gemmobacter sp.]